MWVGEIALRDFRNHRDTAIVLQPGLTLFLGPNGQGKTNLVEALVYLAQLSSHRVSTDAALVRSGADCAVIRASVHHDSRDVSLAIEIRPKGANRAKINGDPVSVTSLLGWLKVVLFAPEDLNLVRGDPGVRRRFIDDLSVSINPSHHQVLGEFDKLLRQRNALLKSARGRKNIAEELSAWDQEFAGISEQITQARHSALEVLSPFFSRAYNVIAPGESVSVEMSATVPHDHSDIGTLRQYYLSLLQARREEEVDRGVTLVGPHRDDIDIRLKGLLARTHASHGEAWSLALSLRIGVAEVIRERSRAGDPVIILDDVLAELDFRRRESVVELVRGYEQVIVTSAVDQDVPESLTGKVFSVSGGQVVARG